MERMPSRKPKARAKKGSSRRPFAVAPHAASTRRVLDDLAQTVEAPSAGPRLLLMDAAESVIAEAGFAGATGTEIARYAGVSLDVFQAHFASKTALLHAMSDRFGAQAVTLLDEATSEAPGEAHDLIYAAIRSILDVTLDRAPLVRAVLSSGDPKMLEGLDRIGAHITTRVTQRLAELEDGKDPRDVAFVLHVTAALAHQAVMGVARWGGVDFDRDELHTRASEMARAYLECPTE
jgi:AcrR family transcriptional regulator